MLENAFINTTFIFIWQSLSNRNDGLSLYIHVSTLTWYSIMGRYSTRKTKKIWLEICETCSQLPHFISIGLGWCFCQFSIPSLEYSLSTQITDPACERTANERWQIWRVLSTADKALTSASYVTVFLQWNR